MSRSIKEEIHDLFRNNFIDREQVRLVSSALNRWQLDTIKTFMDKGEGTLKLTESQLFTTSRFGFSKYYPQEKRDMDELISRGYIEKFEGVTPGHNRYRLTNLGLVVLYYTADDTPQPEVGEVDWGRYTEDDWETIVRLIGPPSPDRVLPPDEVLALIPIYGDADPIYNSDIDLARAIENAKDPGDY